MKSTIFAAIVLLGSLQPCAGESPGTPRVVKEHPRIFLRAADIPALKERCRSSAVVKRAYERLRRFAYSDSMQSNLWVAPEEFLSVLTAWLVEDKDPKLLKRARSYIRFFSKAGGDSWTRPRMLKALACAYDWLHDALGARERRDLADRMAELAAQMRREYRHSDYNNHVYLEYGPLLYAALALANDGVCDDFAAETLAQSEDLLKKHFLPAVNQVGANGQGGWHESMSYWSFFAYELAHQMEAWRTATGEDLFRSSPGLRGAARWLVYCTRPYDGSLAPVADINTPVRWGAQETAYMPLVAARYRDTVSQYVALNVEHRYASRLWPFVLWLDPALGAVDLQSLPTGALFPGIGWAAMRSSWSPDAAWALLVCGNHYAGHQHSDQSSFVIACKGDLAIDAGEYGAKASRFHNTVLIGGGQRLHGNDARRFVAPVAAGSELDTGDILTFEENRLFTCVVADASNAYGDFLNGRRVTKAPRFLRRFIFLKPSTFVVDDFVEAGSPDDEIVWLLHARNAPRMAGGRVRIADGEGELACETLLPREVTRKVTRQTGGRKHLEFHQIEERAAGGGRRIRWLHVLHAGAPAASKMVLDGDTARLAVTADGRAYRLDLPSLEAGVAAAAGRIGISGARDKELLHLRPLAAGILPHDAEGIRALERWDSAYRRSGPAPWDIGRPSTELKKAVENGTIRPCRALVIGCGSGTNATYLARQGFEVTGIDLAPTALSLAAQKAARAGVKARWLLADVLAPPELEPFDFIYDRGCYHGVRRQNAKGYVKSLCRLSRAGTRVLILAGSANEPPPHRGPPRVKEEEIRGDFSSDFEFQRLREARFDARDPQGKGALAWSILLRRKKQP